MPSQKKRAPETRGRREAMVSATSSGVSAIHASAG
jgi:hypothetical protein